MDKDDVVVDVASLFYGAESCHGVGFDAQLLHVLERLRRKSQVHRRA
jgi:hypothetical protein